MSGRIEGDDRDLPDGWSVDEDNWGIRTARAEDHGRRMANALEARRSFFEDGKLYVMTAETAAYFDGENQ